jgi:4'-phosphopantetheinyl transferase
MRHSNQADQGPDPSRVFRLAVCRWSEEFLPLADDEIRVLEIPLECPPYSETELFTHLRPDERSRANRFLVPKPRHQFVVTRGLLRLLLGRILKVYPQEVPIEYTGVGKPVLQGIDVDLHFNVSHTDGLALIALCKRVVGVDVERLRPLGDAAGLVSRFFSPAEQTGFFSLDPDLRINGFFRGWTCKEALIKAVALSVAYLDEFDVELNPLLPASLLAARHPGLLGTEWGLAAWEPGEGYAAAVAVEGVKEIRMKSLEE